MIVITQTAYPSMLVFANTALCGTLKRGAESTTPGTISKFYVALEAT